MKMSRRLWLLLLLLVLAASPWGRVRAQQDQTIYDEEFRLASFADLEYPMVARNARFSLRPPFLCGGYVRECDRSVSPML